MVDGLFVVWVVVCLLVVWVVFGLFVVWVVFSLFEVWVVFGLFVVVFLVVGVGLLVGLVGFGFK